MRKTKNKKKPRLGRARRDKRPSAVRRAAPQPCSPCSFGELDDVYALVAQNRLAEARQALESREPGLAETRVRALVANDLAALAAAEGEWDAARAGFVRALELDADCAAARENLAFLEQERALPKAEASAASADATARGIGPVEVDALGDGAVAVEVVRRDAAAPSAAQGSAVAGLPSRPQSGHATRVAIVSFLFNWPSSGGGIIHTIELNKFLAQAGFEVQHIFCRNLAWGVGHLEAPLPYEPHVLEFDEAAWNIATIQARFREAVRAFQPDYVIITDSWNSKPLLAQAFGDYPYVLRLQASECLCPLNNLRLLPDGGQCPKHQLATPGDCRRCLERWGQWSGSLHQAERTLCGVGTQEYDRTLRWAFQNAHAVLVVEPLAAALVGSYCRQVRVVPSGFDPQRFPWPWPIEPPRVSPRTTILMAGLVEDPIKGFAVLHAACQQLWRERQDFELVATGEPARRVDNFTRFVGWRTQEELPRLLRAADIVVLPPLGQEALGRTAVEAMAVGRPVVASRIGGLPHTLAGEAGLLFEPGDAADLARTLARLLDDAPLRDRLGQAGRRRFEQHYTWDVIIERHYRGLLAGRREAGRARA